MESEAAKPTPASAAVSRKSSPVAARPKPKRHLSLENRVLLLALVAGAGALALALVLLWTGNHDFNTQLSLTILLVAVWLGFAAAARLAVIRPLQTLANMQSALREGDFSFRVRGARMGDALGELMVEVNTLSDMLREQRLGAMEASALLTTVMTEIDVAVFAFDGGRKLRLVNRAGERLLSQNAQQLLGRTADDLDLADCLDGESAQIGRASCRERGKITVGEGTVERERIEDS